MQRLLTVQQFCSLVRSFYYLIFPSSKHRPGSCCNYCLDDATEDYRTS